MRRATTTILALTLLAAACSEESAPPATSAPTTEATTTTAPPGTTTTTAAGTTTTEGPTTTAPPTTTTTTTLPPRPLDEIDLTLVEAGSGFTQPVFLDAPPGDPRLFVVDQDGVIHVVAEGARRTFLDLRDRVVFQREQGLLGMAFHPDDPARFYVHYTDPSGTTTLQEYAVDPEDPDRALPDPVRTLFTAEQPAANHNGGMIAFGPDGHLYLALGDGGGARDRYGNGQNTDTPLGAILRFDVDGGDPYAIPPENPFVDGGGVAEIWAWGLRNPWRFSFDGDLVWIADVGQRSWEEINVVDHRHPGPNFGWPILEGTGCFLGAACDPADTVLPVYEYPHEGGACSVTGGYVYRGNDLPGLRGAYLFGDYCTGVVSALRIDEDGTVVEQRDFPDLSRGALTSFGTDGAGELYLTTLEGRIYRFAAP